MSKMKNNKVEKKQIVRKWHLFDASMENFGRMCSKAALLLRGKNKVTFTPHIDAGDCVIFINSDKLKFSKDKGKTKIYHHFSGYPGGIRSISLGDQITKDSRVIIKKAIYGMLPNNKMRDQIIKRLKIYKNDDHPYKDKFKD